jgi:hypothetical protein
MKLEFGQSRRNQIFRSKVLLGIPRMPVIAHILETQGFKTLRAELFDYAQYRPQGVAWLLTAVILASVVMIGCALSLSNPTHEEQGASSPLPLVEASESGASSVLVTESSDSCDHQGENELLETCPVTQTVQTEGGSRLIFPLVLKGDVGSAKEEKIFLPLFTKSVVSCANRVVRTGDKLTFNGQEIRLIGMNVAYILEEWFPDDQWEGILSFLSQSGNTVRIPVFPKHARDGGLDRVERLIRLGGKYDLKFIIVLESYMAADYPTKNEGWFRSAYQDEYMDHLRSVVTRLRDYPEIALWQLMGEPSCAPEGGRRSCYNALVEWARVASEAIKELDPCRPVAVGMISVGGPQPQGEEAWRSMHALPSIDAVTVHIWTNVWYERELRIADEMNLPVLYTEVYHRAYKKNGRLLHKGILEERAPIIEDFMQRSFDAGVDGIILWQYIHQGYCGELDYNQSDPIWKVLQSFSDEQQGNE